MFTLRHADGNARLGFMRTTHGVVETPMFMPVGTQATVKGLTPEQLHSVGASIILGNTYHLTLRPGDELIAELGGLHRFMNWPGPILTDSGGYQVFSLSKIRKITDHAATFRSHLDGAMLELTPERAVKIQENLGSDIAMVLDECPPGDATETVLRSAVRRTLLWAERSKRAHTREDQALFAIVQGASNLELRGECAKELVAMDFPGYALGGFSVGEAPEIMHAALGPCAAMLPADKPRYLMGVGRPEDLLASIDAGIDIFDCVLPTRNGRNGQAFTFDGKLNLKNAKHKRDPQPVESGCACYCCVHFSRAYVHHLFNVGEMLGPTLMSMHNIAFLLRLMGESRKAIAEDRWASFREVCLARWQRTT